MSHATVVAEGSRPAVRLERLLPDPPETVWEAITDRGQLQQWFPSDVEVDGGEWTPGAAITFRFPADVIDMTLRGEVLVVDRPRALAFTWGEETLRFALEPEGSGTRRVLTDELPAAHAARNAVGWDECLDRLCRLETKSAAWQVRFDRYREAFEPVLGPQEGPPAGYKG